MTPYEIAATYATDAFDPWTTEPSDPIVLPGVVPQAASKRKRWHRATEAELADIMVQYCDVTRYSSINLIAKHLAAEPSVIRRQLITSKHGYAYGVIARRRTFGGDLYHLRPPNINNKLRD
jgi:hypothetical protein